MRRRCALLEPTDVQHRAVENRSALRVGQLAPASKPESSWYRRPGWPVSRRRRPVSIQHTVKYTELAPDTVQAVSMKAKDRALEAIRAIPRKSNRAIADEIGVRAREATGD